MTEITWPAPFGYTVFCDDVRREMLGKTTHVGIYGGDMRVMGEPPIHLPRLTLVVNFYEKMGEGSDPLELQIYLPSDGETPSNKIEISPRDHAAGQGEPGEDNRALLSFVLEMAPFNITQFGKLRVRMKKGDDILRLGSLNIAAATPDQKMAWQAEAPSAGVDVKPEGEGN